MTVDIDPIVIDYWEWLGMQAYHDDQYSDRPIARCPACGFGVNFYRDNTTDSQALVRHWKNSPFCETSLWGDFLFTQIDAALAQGRATQKRKASGQTGLFQALGGKQ